jgi:hypothetical protein
MFRGSGQGGKWTEQDWADYARDRDAYWSGERQWIDGSTRQGIGGFVLHMSRLAANYINGEETEFVKAVGLIWGGIPMRNRIAAGMEFVFNTPSVVWSRNGTQPLVEGDANWRAEYNECPGNCDNASHHYAAFFYMGYMFGAPVGKEMNWVRDSFLGYVPQDLALGDMAAVHGGMLAWGEISIQGVSRILSAALDVRSHVVDPKP